MPRAVDEFLMGEPAAALISSALKRFAKAVRGPPFYDPVPEHATHAQGPRHQRPPNLNLLGTRSPRSTARPRSPTSRTACARRGEALGIEVLCFRATTRARSSIASTPRAPRASRGSSSTPAPTPIPAWRSATRSPGGDPLRRCISPTCTGVKPFRHHSYLSDVAEAVMAASACYGYGLALQYIALRLN